MCKCGSGTEKTPGECDTPGFAHSKEYKIENDHRGSRKLYLPRNHNRITQTSKDMLQSWRANCDIQILIYNSNPKTPSVAEISKITDYIASYATKGNGTIRQEREQNVKLAMA